jgi:hypothetical protein
MNEKSQLPRVFVDFHNSDRQGRVRLNTVGTVEDLNRLGVVLRKGTEILLYCLEAETKAVVSYSTEEGLWVATIDWARIRDLPGNSSEGAD